MAKVIFNADTEILGNLKLTNVPNALGDFLTLDAQGNVRFRTAAQVGIEFTSTDKNYIHEQVASSSVWNIAHNLGKFASIIVVDSAKTVLLGQIEYIDINNVTLTFNSAFTGYAYFN
jgi:hypothetical protein